MKTLLTLCLAIIGLAGFASAADASEYRHHARPAYYHHHYHHYYHHHRYYWHHGHRVYY